MRVERTVCPNAFGSTSTGNLHAQADVRFSQTAAKAIEKSYRRRCYPDEDQEATSDRTLRPRCLPHEASIEQRQIVSGQESTSATGYNRINTGRFNANRKASCEVSRELVNGASSLSSRISQPKTRQRTAVWGRRPMALLGSSTSAILLQGLAGKRTIMVGPSGTTCD